MRRGYALGEAVTAARMTSVDWQLQLSVCVRHYNIADEAGGSVVNEVGVGLELDFG